LGRYFQAQEINELQVRDGLTNFFAPQYADHAVVSFWHRFSSDIDLRVELYQKKYDSLMPRFENAFDSRVLLPELQIDRARTDATSATAKGAEITVSGEKQDGSFEWWAGYSWSSIIDRVDGVSVKRNWDQSHSIKGGFIAAKGQWDFSVAGAWHSGWPATELIVETIEFPGGSSQPFASTTPRNSLEYSSFHTVDARVSRSFQLRKSELTAYLEISNIYDRQNPCCIRYSVGADSVGDSLLIEDVDYWLPLVPTLGVVWRF
jgi:hypothetical protein